MEEKRLECLMMLQIHSDTPSTDGVIDWFATTAALLNFLIWVYACISVHRAVASLEEAEGHQHLAGGHGGGCEQMSPLPLRGSGVRDLRIFYIYF